MRRVEKKREEDMVKRRKTKKRFKETRESYFPRPK